jgi:IS5 family transposase
MASSEPLSPLKVGPRVRIRLPPAESRLRTRSSLICQRSDRTKSKVRARVEHAIGVIKRVFGFAKVRYRGLKKNTHRLLVTCALANLFMVRRQLLRCQRA